MRRRITGLLLCLAVLCSIVFPYFSLAAEEKPDGFHISTLSAALQSEKQEEPVVEELGTKIHSAPVSRSIFGYDKEGNLLAFSAVTGDPVQLVVTNVATEEVMQISVEDTQAERKATMIRGMASCVIEDKGLHGGALVTNASYDKHVWSDAIFTIGPDQKLYVLQGRTFYQFDFETKKQTVYGSGKTMAQDFDGNFFVSDGTLLYKYRIPGVSQSLDRDGIKVELNGEKITFEADQPPVLTEAGRTLIPMRKLFEALGAVITWDEAAQTVTAVKGDITVILGMGELRASKNGVEIPLDQPAVLMNDRTMVPVRFVAEALGAEVTWNEETNTVCISSAE